VVALLSSIPPRSSPPSRPARSSELSNLVDVGAVIPLRPASTFAGPSLQAAAACRARPSRATFRRRRIAASGVLFLLALLAVIVVHGALDRIGGGPLNTTDATSGPQAATAQAWVVKPGDTIWSIATSLEPRGDVRPLVDRLYKEVGGAPLYPGETIPIPSAG
jgi:hypothetical protein